MQGMFYLFKDYYKQLAKATKKDRFTNITQTFGFLIVIKRRTKCL